MTSTITEDPALLPGTDQWLTHLNQQTPLGAVSDVRIDEQANMIAILSGATRETNILYGAGDTAGVLILAEVEVYGHVLGKRSMAQKILSGLILS